jgi:hypothetical protein
MGIPTLIKTLTASDSATLSFVDGASSVVLDNTYDEYMFVYTDIGPATDSADFTFQCNAVGASGYNEVITSTYHQAQNLEDGSVANIGGSDGPYLQNNGTSFQDLTDNQGNGSDESLAGILYLFSPASTTYVKHWHAKTHQYAANNGAPTRYFAGYFNITAAIDDIQFKMSTGNFDGVIQMYGVA